MVLSCINQKRKYKTLKVKLHSVVSWIVYLRSTNITTFKSTNHLNLLICYTINLNLDIMYFLRLKIYTLILKQPKTYSNHSKIYLWWQCYSLINSIIFVLQYSKPSLCQCSKTIKPFSRLTIGRCLDRNSKHLKYRKMNFTCFYLSLCQTNYPLWTLKIR